MAPQTSQIDQLNDLDIEAFVFLDTKTQQYVDTLVSEILVTYNKLYKGADLTTGNIALQAGFNIDKIISLSIEKYYDIAKRNIEEIANKATKKINAFFKLDTVYRQNIDKATNAYIKQIQTYLYYYNPQLNEIKQAMQANRIAETKPYVTPATFSSDALAILAGATYDNKLGTTIRDDQGNYAVDGYIYSGLLYTTGAALQAAIELFFAENGRNPIIQYQWVHITPPDRAFPEHLALGGRTFTATTAPIVLANTTRPYIGPFFYPQDHPYCRCAVTTKFI